jgi:soluble lytic murein transglycosylase-like protein
MVTSLFTLHRSSENNTLRSCFILILAVPAFAASPQGHISTVVKADVKTGRLVRSVAFSPPASSLQTGTLQTGTLQTGTLRAATVTEWSAASNDASSLDNLIDQIATEQGVENHLVHSVIRAESNYNANALSPKGAQGIMQLIPATARRFGVSNSFDPTDNIRGGVRYLRFLLDYYQGDYPKTIAAYNAGEAAVDKYNGVPPYAETRNYVVQVARNLKAARQTAPKTIPVVFAQSDLPNPETPKPIQASTGSDGRVYYRTP